MRCRPLPRRRFVTTSETTMREHLAEVIRLAWLRYAPDAEGRARNAADAVLAWAEDGCWSGTRETTEITPNREGWRVCVGCPHPGTCESRGCQWPSDAVVKLATPTPPEAPVTDAPKQVTHEDAAFLRQLADEYDALAISEGDQEFHTPHTGHRIRASALREIADALEVPPPALTRAQIEQLPMVEAPSGYANAREKLVRLADLLSALGEPQT